MPDLVKSIAVAIARQEGWYDDATTLSQTNNNPGDLRTWGSWPINAGYVRFSSPEAGWKALYTQVRAMIGLKLNLFEMFGGQRDAKGNVIPGGYPGYAPAADKNYPIVYANNVASWTGLDPSRPVWGYAEAPAALPWGLAKGGPGRAGSDDTGNPLVAAGETEGAPAAVDDLGTAADLSASVLPSPASFLSASVVLPALGEVPLWQAGLIGAAAGLALWLVLD